MGWLCGLKLHFVINDKGEITGFTLTPGNVDDRDLSVIAKVTNGLWGKLLVIGVIYLKSSLKNSGREESKSSQSLNRT